MPLVMRRCRFATAPPASQHPFERKVSLACGYARFQDTYGALSYAVACGPERVSAGGCGQFGGGDQASGVFARLTLIEGCLPSCGLRIMAP
jgi:hypothetical protein